jgi:predicted histidine transporter YuiF (NhaC family)
MSKIKEYLNNPHIQIALATGLSIIVMAYFSKRVLPQPIGYLPLAIPPFIASIAEVLINKYKDHQSILTKIGIAAILLSTVLVIILSSV